MTPWLRTPVLAAALSALLAGACAPSVASTDSGAPADASGMDATADASAPPVDAADAAVDAAMDTPAVPEAGAPRALGAVVRATPDVPCGMPNTPPGATCTELVVRCPGMPDLQAIVALARPAGAPRGTIVTHMGSGGTTFNAMNVPGFLNAGFRVAQVRWVTDWEETPSGDMLASGCRPATAFRWVFDQVHGASTAEPFCGAGFSGGSGALSYTMAHYGGGSFLDYVQLTAGPPFARIDFGCAASEYTGPPRSPCPELTNAPIFLPPSLINPWSNTTTCGAARPDPAEIARWRANSVVSPGAVYAYPQTRVDFYLCATMPNGTTGQASFYRERITSEASVTCFTDCMVEDTGAAGRARALMDMTARCTPRHR